MKKIVAIMAVSLMMLASCGKTNGFVSSELNKDSEGNENIWSVNYVKKNTPVVEKTFLEKYGEILGITALFVVPFCTYLGIKKCCGCCNKGVKNNIQNPDPQAGNAE